MRKHTIQLYRDAAREWRWRVVAPNGKTVADSGEGYKRRASALKAVQKLTAALAAGAEIVEVER